MTEHQKGADGARPAVAAQPDQQTAEQQKLAAGPAAGAVAVEPPEDEKYTVHVPEGLTYFDLDLIKLTAQFVARNGKGFLTGGSFQQLHMHDESKHDSTCHIRGTSPLP